MRRDAALSPDATGNRAPAVLPLGAIVLTMDGVLPVEYLGPGDRIVTRRGMRVLRRIETPAPQHFALGFDTPQVIYADGRPVLSDSAAAAPD
ncbi:MAG: hypothetical protein ACP5DX_10035 [Paracoccaceae bacterium]